MELRTYENFQFFMRNASSSHAHAHAHAHASAKILKYADTENI